MDTHAHLLSLGWAGPGHSLDSKPYNQKGVRGLAYDPAKVGNNGNGLVKPLSISQRRGRFGIGKKAHEPQAGNEWWLKGFESALGNIGKSESERGSGTPTSVSAAYAGKHGGLYGFFIKSQEMQGTIGEMETIKCTSKKRKSDVLDDHPGDDTSKVSKFEAERSTSKFEHAGTFFALRDKGEKRRHQPQRVTPVEDFEKIGKYLKVRTEYPNKKKRKSEAAASEVSIPLETALPEEHGSDRAEMREERRERRRLRREQKQRASAALENQRQLDARSERTQTAAAKAARKAKCKQKNAERNETTTRMS